MAEYVDEVRRRLLTLRAEEDEDAFAPSEDLRSMIALLVDRTRDSAQQLLKITDDLRTVRTLDDVESDLIDADVAIKQLDDHWTQLNQALEREDYGIQEDDEDDFDR